MIGRSSVTVIREGATSEVFYGYDVERGFRVSVYRAGESVVQFMSIVSGYQGLAGALDLLVEYQVFDRDDVLLGLAAAYLKHSIADIEEPAARIVAGIVVELVGAARIQTDF